MMEKMDNGPNTLGVPTTVGEQVGERLREARLAKGKSIDELAQKVRIRYHYLQSMEDGQWDSLPPGVHGRGLVRVYARELGVMVPELDPSTSEWLSENRKGVVQHPLKAVAERIQKGYAEPEMQVKTISRSEYDAQLRQQPPPVSTPAPYSRSASHVSPLNRRVDAHAVISRRVPTPTAVRNASQPTPATVPNRGELEDVSALDVTTPDLAAVLGIEQEFLALQNNKSQDKLESSAAVLHEPTAQAEAVPDTSQTQEDEIPSVSLDGLLPGHVTEVLHAEPLHALRDSPVPTSEPEHELLPEDLIPQRRFGASGPTQDATPDVIPLIPPASSPAQAAHIAATLNLATDENPVADLEGNDGAFPSGNTQLDSQDMVEAHETKSGESPLVLASLTERLNRETAGAAASDGGASQPFDVSEEPPKGQAPAASPSPSLPKGVLWGLALAAGALFAVILFRNTSTPPAAHGDDTRAGLAARSPAALAPKNSGTDSDPQKAMTPTLEITSNPASLAQTTNGSNGSLSPQGPQTATLFLTGRTEVLLVVDGEKIKSGVQPMGEIPIQFQKTVEITVNDGSKVNLKYGDWDHGPLGAKGRKRKITLHARSLGSD